MRPARRQRLGALTTFVAAVVAAIAGCARDEAPRGDACEREGTDSARAVCVALDAARRRTGQEPQALEFRRDSAGYSILTIPTKSLATDGDLTVHVSHAFEVTGFGPDSA
jgi:hypothetical protein